MTNEKDERVRMMCTGRKNKTHAVTHAVRARLAVAARVEAERTLAVNFAQLLGLW